METFVTGAKMDLAAYYCWGLMLLIISIFVLFTYLIMNEIDYILILFPMIGLMVFLNIIFLKTRYEFNDTELKQRVKYLQNKTINYSEIRKVTEVTNRMLFNHRFETNIIILGYKGKEYGIIPKDKEKALAILKENCPDVEFNKEVRSVSSKKPYQKEIKN
jgi:hypothetical protein